MIAWYILFLFLWVVSVILFFVVDGFEHSYLKIFLCGLILLFGLLFLIFLQRPDYAEVERNDVSNYTLSILNDEDKDVYRCIGELENGMSFDIELHDLIIGTDDSAVLVKYADSGFIGDDWNRGTPYYDLILPVDKVRG